MSRAGSARLGALTAHPGAANARPAAATDRPAAAAAVCLGAIAITMACPAVPVAAQGPGSLQGLVVTANRLHQPEWAAAAHTTILHGPELERAGIEYVADALRQLPGVALARGGSFGAITSLFLRGGESDYVQVLVDGVRVNEPGGAFDFASLTTDNVERIEIVRGPASALYGSDAVSGVIQIFTRRGSGRPRGDLSFQGGSYGTRRWQGGLSGGTGSLSYAFSAGRNETDGILDFNNEFLQTTVTGLVQGRLDEAADASVSVRYEDRRFHYPTDGSGNLVDENANSFGDALSVNIGAGRRWSDGFETRFGINVHESDAGTDDAPDGPADTLGYHGFKSLADLRRTTLGGRAIWRPGEERSVAAGYELEQQSVRDFSESLSQWGPSSANSRNERGNQAFYAQLSEFRGPAALNAGLRLEDNERFGAAMTWRAGAAWRAASSGTRMRASAGTGIKEPTFYETYATGFATGNPELEPEESTSFEAGLDQELGSIGRLSITGFSQSYRNLIQYTFSPPEPGGPNYHNVARARSRGLEAEASVAVSRVRLSGFYTYLDTEVEDAGFDEGPSATFVEGEPLLRRPRHTVGASALVQVASEIGLDASVRRTGERGDRDFSGYPAVPVTLPAYTLVDLAASFELAPAPGRAGMRLTLRMENLLDESYHEVWGFAAPGRAVYVGGSVAVGGSEG